MAPGSASAPKSCPPHTKSCASPWPCRTREERVAFRDYRKKEGGVLITLGPHSLALEEADPGIKGRGDGFGYDEKLLVSIAMHL